MKIKALALSLLLACNISANAFDDGEGNITPERPPTKVTFTVSSASLPSCLLSESASYCMFRIRIVAGKAMDREWLLSGPVGNQQVHQVKSVFLASNCNSFEYSDRSKPEKEGVFPMQSYDTGSITEALNGGITAYLSGTMLEKKDRSMSRCLLTATTLPLENEKIFEKYVMSRLSNIHVNLRVNTISMNSDLDIPVYELALTSVLLYDNETLVQTIDITEPISQTFRGYVRCRITNHSD